MSLVDQLIAAASGEIGRPYTYGAEGPTTFDCSGLMQYVFGEIGISLPRTAAQQQAATTPTRSPLPGDLVFYGDPAHHVGLYIGGGQMISAPHTGATVHISGVGTPTGYGRVAGLGTLAASAVGLVTPTGITSDIIGPLQGVLWEIIAVGAGLGLAGVGLYHLATAPAAGRIRKALHL